MPPKKKDNNNDPTNHSTKNRRSLPPLPVAVALVAYVAALDIAIAREALVCHCLWGWFLFDEFIVGGWWGVWRE